MIVRLMLLCCLLLVSGPAAAQTGFDPFRQARIDVRPGAQVPLAAPLVDARGERTTLRQLAAGRPVLLAPVLHECPNMCDVTLAGLARAVAAQRLRPGADFTVVAFGIDPQEGPQAAADDLSRLRQHAPARAVDAMRAVVGAPGSVRAVTDALGYHYAWDPRIGQYAHAAAVAVLTPDGRLSSWLYGVTPLPGDVQRALEQARAGAEGSWTDQLLLLCYHYDPASGRYTLAITKLLKLAALLTVAALAVLILHLRRRPA